MEHHPTIRSHSPTVTEEVGPVRSPLAAARPTLGHADFSGECVTTSRTESLVTGWSINFDIAMRHASQIFRSDIKDAAHFQCVTSVIFMFFASFVPAISFGGLLGMCSTVAIVTSSRLILSLYIGKYTDEKIGMIETLFAQSLCGIIWSIFSAQPLLISMLLLISILPANKLKNGRI
jgi:hypothetical protein